MVAGSVAVLRFRRRRPGMGALPANGDQRQLIRNRGEQCREQAEIVIR